MCSQELLKTPTTDRGLKPETTGSVVSVGVDWLTITTPKDSTGYAFYDLAKDYWKENGIKHKDWRNKYYFGRASDGLYWGYGKQGYILMVTGKMSPVLWRKGLTLGGRVTRMDLQVTVDVNEYQPTQAEWYNHIKRLGYHKKRQYGLIENTKGGVTLYAGSRQSDQYGRFYDKGAEQGQAPGELYRYEIELKKPRSMAVANSIIDRLAQNDDIQKAIEFYVYQWWLDRGVIPAFSATRTNVLNSVSAKIETTNEKKLLWLRAQVRPTVGRLIDELGQDVVFDALGLTSLS